MSFDPISSWGNSGSNYGSEPSISFSDAKSGKGSGGGTYSWEIGLNLIFWDEIRRYDDAFNPPTFDGGMVTEIVGKGKCKVKLQGLGSVVTIDLGYNDNVKKGMYALVLCQMDKTGKIVKYKMISAKNIKYADGSDSVSEYEV